MIPWVTGAAPTAAGADAVTRARAVVGGLRVPAPGSGDTLGRLDVLADHARDDIPTARLVEAHVDAGSILADLGIGSTGPDELWGVWAAEAPGARLSATHRDGRWCLDGVKAWCSGAVGCTHALVTAWVGDERALFAVDLARGGVAPDTTDRWWSVGMAATNTRPVRFDGTPARRVGSVTDYFGRPGFWHGAIGVAACWFGGARAVGDRVLRTRRDDAITRAHVGAVDAALWTGHAALAEAASVVDRHPDDVAIAHTTALRTRAVIEGVVTTVLDRAGRALGPGPMVAEADHVAAVADLTVYVRQSHADHDLAALGDLVADDGADR
jgi:hypothetical protein